MFYVYFLLSFSLCFIFYIFCFPYYPFLYFFLFTFYSSYINTVLEVGSNLTWFCSNTPCNTPATYVQQFHEIHADPLWFYMHTDGLRISCHMLTDLVQLMCKILCRFNAIFVQILLRFEVILVKEMRENKSRNFFLGKRRWVFLLIENRLILWSVFERLNIESEIYVVIFSFLVLEYFSVLSSCGWVFRLGHMNLCMFVIVTS